MLAWRLRLESERFECTYPSRPTANADWVLCTWYYDVEQILVMYTSSFLRFRILHSKIGFYMRYVKTCNISNKLFSLNGQQLILKDPLCYGNKVASPSEYEKLSTSVILKGSDVSRLGKFKRKIFDALSSSSKIKLGAVVAYEKCADSLDYSEFFSYFSLPDTFQSWFLTLQLHVWMCSTVIVSESNGKIFRNRLIDSMWNDVELRLNNLKEIRSSARKEYLSDMVEQFQAALISYDEGLHSHDVVLAAAAWRTIYGFRPVDPRILEALVLYIRKQVDHLDSLNSADVMFKGTIEFLPLQNIVSNITFKNTL
ncbi:ubiquinol-cytochrome-c reductase complex assembly factor 1 [Trichonephila clavata]|uniref:Ubiquinol-cytochrome-c reductase complex assembly factor 1 n=1 Tax=Trichonephila clavata TaxID=2740835 RepID=A0A8X6GEC7_TRICU|nr:ubiquinol-cytochrome-c reductase complex assembly factor 1 [Trichonephila clavata]